jgi:hypothetical protein
MFDAPEVVDEWNLLQAAKWIGVAPWELLKQPAGWLLAILSALEVENSVFKSMKGKRA